MTTPVTEGTGYSIIADAMRNACLLPEGDDPDSEELARHVRRLNQLITFQMTQGIKLFVHEDTQIPLVAGQSLYSLGPTGNVVMPKPLDVDDQFYLYSAANGGTRRPVFRISKQEWDMLSTPSQQGPITQIWVDQQPYVLNVNTWLIPDANEATGVLNLWLRNQIVTFVGFTDTMQFPSEWTLWLGWQLGSEIATGQPQSIINRCDMKAAFYLEKLEEWDAEQNTSILPQPDQRMLQRKIFAR